MCPFARRFVSGSSAWARSNAIIRGISRTRKSTNDRTAGRSPPELGDALVQGLDSIDRCRSTDQGSRLPTAAVALDVAYTRVMTVRRQICPLDLADDLPPMTFGAARVAQFSAEESEKLFDAPRFAGNVPTLPFESKRLAQGLAGQCCDLGAVAIPLRAFPLIA
jgi:hypothetical protein